MRAAKIKKHLSVFLYLIFLNAMAQEKCATDIYHKLNRGKFNYLIEYYKKQFPKFGNQRVALNGVITIPVVVHVIHSVADNTIGVGSNISDEQILSQFPVLNQDYRRKIGSNGYNTNALGADVEIEFCLATTDPNCNPTNGITRHYSTKTTYNPTSDFETGLVKSFSQWPNTDYLNIWVVSLSGGYLGYAQFPNYTGLAGLDSVSGLPAEDGVLIASKVFGANSGLATKGIYNLGRTVTHEIGHWLGLKHTWGDEICGTDYCEDTPSCASSFSGPGCKDIYSNCLTLTGRTRNMIENYLDYSPDACMNIFTRDQKNRMRTVFTTSPERIQILSSKGCESNASVGLPFKINFENGSKVTDQWASTATANLGWEYFTNGAFGASSNAARINNRLSNIGKSSVLNSLPYLDLQGFEYPVLSFDLAYPNIESTDSLVISAYTGCTTPAIYIKSFKGSELITTQNTQSNFLPQPRDWVTKFINLKRVNTEKFIKIQFENHSKGKGTLYLDNIHVYNSSKELSVKINNNPSAISSSINYNQSIARLNVEVLFEGPSDVSFEIYDLTGKNIYNQSFTKAIPGNFYLDNVSFASGMYIVKTTVGNQISVNKVIIQMQ